VSGGAADPPARHAAATASRGVLAVLAAAVLFGTTGTAQALGPDGTTPATVGAARLAVGGAALVVMAWAASRSTRPLLAICRTRWGLVAAVFVAVYQLCFFAGTSRAGVAAGTLVTIGSAPFLTGLLAWAVDRVAPGRAWAGATTVAVGGLALLSLGGASGGAGDPAGLWFSLASGLGYAAYTVAGKRLIGQGHASLDVMAASFGLGGVLLLPVLIAGPTAWLATPSGAALALYLGLVPTALAYAMYGRGLAVLPSGTVATLVLAEPVVATLLGVAVLGESLGAAGAAGCALVVVALGMLARHTTRSAPAPVGV
jgi:DME family drug/metabolite transporter